MKLRPFILIFVILLSLCRKGNAQIVISNQGATAQTILNGFIGAGLSISNATINCDATAYGTFTGGGSTNLGITSGVLLTTGTAASVAGNTGSSSTTGAFYTSCSDAQLLSLDPSADNDCCILEFDIVPYCNQISVRFVFGSEEYPEFVNSSFNDAFGFFITGPKPGGGNYSNQDVALLPGTSTIVSIDNVNATTNSSYYVNNTGSYIEYDGFTTAITSTVSLIPCQSYHFKIAIADAGDAAYDSGVFIDFLSCTNVMTLTTSSTPATCGNNDGTASVTVTNGFPAFTYTWTPAPGAGQGTTNVSGLSAGTYSVIVDDSYACIPPDTAVVTVAGPANPTITVNSGSICGGGNLTLTAGGATTYSWAPATGLSATSGTSVTASPTVTTTYTVTGTTSGCSGTAISTVTVAGGPTVTVNSPTYCSGNSATLTASGATTYSWSPATGLSATTGATVTANPTTTTIYTVTGTTSGCNGVMTSTVTVNPLPTPTAGNDSPQCANGTVNLNSSGGVSYQWSGPNSYSSNSQNPQLTSVTASMSGTYTVQVTDANSCVANATTSVTINPLPTPSAGSDSPQCINGTINLNASGGVSYQWSGPNAYSSNSQNPQLTSITTSMSGTYTVQVTDANNCVASTTTSVTVNPLPVPTAGSDSPQCENGIINFTSSGGTSYQWSGPGSFSSNSQNPQMTNITQAMTGTYTVVVTDANGCSASATTDIVVNPPPTITIGNDSPQCENGTINLNASGGTSYQWSGPNSYSSSSQNPQLTGVTTAMSGTYTVQVTSASGCITYTTTNVVVNPLPTPVAGSDSPQCVNGTINLNTSGGVSYQWSGPGAFSSTSQSPQLTSITTSMSGTYTVQVTDANNCVASTTTDIIVNALPTPTAGSDSPQCVNGTINFTASGGVNYQWSGPGAFSSAIQNPQLTGLTQAMAGTYTVQVTDANGCIASTTTDVLVNPPPTPTAGSDSPQCESGTINLNSSGGVSYQWSGPNSYSSNTQNPQLTAITPGMSVTYTVLVTDANGCFASATTDIIVNPLPFPTASSDSPQCLGGTLTFNATGGTQYQWIGPNSFADNTQNPQLTNLTLAMAGTYTVVATDANGCFASVTTNVVVNPLPTIVASTDAPQCLNGSIHLFGSGGVSYIWAGPNSFTSPNQNPTLNNVAIATEGTYTLTAVDANGCANVDSIAVAVYPLPNVMASNSSPVCLNDPITFTGDSASIYSWTGPNNFSIQNPSIPSASLSDAGTYTLTGTDTHGCVNMATTTVVVNDLPVVIATTNVICENTALSLSSSGGITYSWTGPNGFSSTAQNPVVSTSASASLSGGVYIVTAIDVNGCSNFAPVTASVTPLPAAPYGNDVVYCLNDPTSPLTAASATNATLNWYGTNPLGVSSITANTPSSSSTGTVYYYVSQTVDGCEGPKDSIAVLINPLPTGTLAQVATQCAPLCDDFTFSSSSVITSWQWQMGDGPLGTNDDTVHYCYQNSGYYSIQVTITDNNGCESTVPFTNWVYVAPNPIADFDYTPNPITIFDPEATFVSTSYGQNIVATDWNFQYGSQSLLTSTSGQQYILFPDTGIYSVTLTVETADGCIDSITKPVKVLDDFDVYIPNAFSPNADAVNDIFKAYGTGIKSSKMWIFDRWGELIFTGDGMENGWDGTYNGRTVIEDTYIYKFQYNAINGGKGTKTGHVTVVR